MAAADVYDRLVGIFVAAGPRSVCFFVVSDLVWCKGRDYCCRFPFMSWHVCLSVLESHGANILPLLFSTTQRLLIFFCLAAFRYVARSKRILQAFHLYAFYLESHGSGVFGGSYCTSKNQCCKFARAAFSVF